MDDLVQKAATLQEALPYIRRFHGRTFVVKYGGHAMVDAELKESFAKDVCLLRFIGIQIVVVHGGGPQIDETLKRMGIESTFSAGLRVTDDETMNVVEMVLAGGVNSDIVGLISKQGGRAMGLSGRDDAFMRAVRHERVKGRDDQGASVQVDLGRVGKLTTVEPALVTNLISEGYIPVIAPIAIDREGRPLNVNADNAAGRIAEALHAAKLILLTDVGGVADEQGNRMSSLTHAEVEKLVDDGVIEGGMIPKVRCALDAVANGVEKAHIVDGRRRHALLLETFTDRGVGTEIRHQR